MDSIGPFASRPKPLRNRRVKVRGHKAGLDELEAIKAITINAAEILELNDRLGSLEVGKDADVVIWNDHPFNLQATVHTTIVDGRVVYEKQ